MPSPHAAIDPPGKPGVVEPSTQTLIFSPMNGSYPLIFSMQRSSSTLFLATRLARSMTSSDTPTKKFAKVANLANEFFGELQKEMIEDLVANGKEDASHFILTHNKD